MKKLKNIIWGVLCSVVSLAIVSCSHDEPTTPTQNSDEDNIWHKGVLNYNPIVTNVVSRSGQNSTYEPTNGDMLLLQFYTSNNSTVSGYACYNSTSDIWEFSYKGTLEICSNLKCKVTYIGNNPILNSGQNLVELGLNCPIYECDNGVYRFNDSNMIDLYAQLSPATARIKFKGNKESNFLFKGVNGRAKIDIESWSYSEYAEGLSGTISESEYYSPYYYITSQYIGHYYDLIDCRNLWVKDGAMVYVWNKDISNCLKAGSSGVIFLPDIAPSDWHSDSYKEMNVSDITFVPNNVFDTPDFGRDPEAIMRFESNVGIHISFDYNPYKLDDSNVYCIDVYIYAHDKSGNLINRYNINSYVDYLLDDLNTINHVDYACFSEGATYYNIEFFGVNIGAKITNFKISNF